MGTIIDDQLAINNDVVDAHRVLFGVVEGGFGLHRVRVKYHHVGLHAVPQDTPVLQSQPLGGQGGHLADRFLHPEQALLPGKLAQYIRKGAECPGVGHLAGQNPVGTDHVGGVADDGAYVLRVSGPGHKAHFQVLLNQQVADGVHHLLALEGGQVGERPALPFLVLVRSDVADYVVVQGPAPHGVHRVADPLADGRVLDPLQQHRGPPGVDPIGQQGMQDGAGGGIGILVEGHIDSGVPSLVHQVDHLLSHAVDGAVKVGNVYRHAAPLADLNGLPERIKQLVAFGVAGVGNVEPAQVRYRFTDRHQLAGVAVGAGRVGQTGGKPEGPVLHALTGQFLHPGQLRRCGRPVLPAHGLDSDGGVGHHERHVAGGAAVQKIQEFLNRAPAGVRRWSPVYRGQIGD